MRSALGAVAAEARGAAWACSPPNTPQAARMASKMTPLRNDTRRWEVLQIMAWSFGQARAEGSSVARREEDLAQRLGRAVQVEGRKGFRSGRVAT